MTQEELHQLVTEIRKQQAAAAAPEQPAAEQEPVLPEEPPVSPLPDAPAEDAMPFVYDTAEETVVKQPRHLMLRIFCVLTVLLFLAFSVFCIVRDVQTGTTSGGRYLAGEVVQVELVQHDKPSVDETMTDSSGRYSYAGIAQKVMPSIVEIYTYTDGKMSGSGSGIILTADGYIATNAHVVSKATSCAVRLFDEDKGDKNYEASVIGHDTKTDLAVLKISVSGLTPATLGDSDQVQLGESVCALGNPAGLSGSITTGIISGMNRKVRAGSNNFEMDCFQTDAAISPGNSGGALVNLYGQVIGITSSKYSTSSLTGSSVYEGLGFAITINQALPILKELMEKGYVSGRVRIGISFLDHSSAMKQAEQDKMRVPDLLKTRGVLILKIDEDSDLKQTALRLGDWILSMNGRDVMTYDDLNKAVEGYKAGDTVHCLCCRVKETGETETFEIQFKLLEDHSGEY